MTSAAFALGGAVLALVLLAQPSPGGAAETARSAAGVTRLDAAAVVRLAEAIGADVEAAGALSPAETAATLGAALASFKEIEAAARRANEGHEAADEGRRDEAPAAARAAIAALARRGVTRTILASRLVEATVAGFDPTGVTAAERVAAFADLDRIAAAIEESTARAAALTAIGGLHRRLGNHERAARYGQLVGQAARAGAAGEGRDRALAGALDLVTAAGRDWVPAHVVPLLDGFADPGRRALALAGAARRLASDADDRFSPDLATVVSADDAAILARMRLAADRADDDLATVLAAAVPSPAAARAALDDLVALQLRGGRDLAALGTARLMRPDARARAEAAVALSLARRGYGGMALALVDRADAPADGEVAEDVATARSVASATRQRPADVGRLAAGLRAAAADPVEGERAALALAAARSDLSGALAVVRALREDRLRVAAFRAIAEETARALDPGGPAAAAAGRPEARGTGMDLFGSRDARLVAGDLVRAAAPVAVPAIADLALTADRVRAAAPLPEPGVGGLSLAGLNRFTRLNRFNSKFLEDVVGTTAREHIFRTQGTINPTFVYLTDGVFTARDLLHAIDGSRSRQLVREGDAYTLRVPLVIGPDATLVLTGLDAPTFRLSADAGAFIVNAGRLYVVDVDLVGWSEEANGPARATYADKHDFRPFVTAWSGSETHVAGAVVDALGYSAGKSYGLTFSSGPKDGRGTSDALPRPTGTLVDSLFRNIYYGYYTYEADDMHIVGNTYEDSIVYGLDPHDRSRRLSMVYNTLYGTMEKHGAIFSRDVVHSALYGNVSFDNAGSGFMLDRRSTFNLVRANTAIGNAQDGMTVYESPCVLIAANRFADNRRSGVKIRNSWSVMLDDNAISGNAGPALEAYVADLAGTEDGAARDLHEDPYVPIASFSASASRVSGNGAGIAARGASAVALSGTRFEDQGVRLYDGDLKAFRVELLRAAGAGRAATVVPRDAGAPSADDAAAAGTPDCPPPGRRGAPPSGS